MIEKDFIKLVSDKWNITKECVYDTIHSIVRGQINNYKGQAYFPFIYTLFIFILINNFSFYFHLHFIYNCDLK